MSQISIIIPTKDRQAIFEETLASVIAATAHIDAEIIVINDSKTNEVTLTEQQKAKVKVVNNPQSGVASARNLGAFTASSELILFLDNDMLIHKESIDSTLKIHQAHSDICLNLNWVYPESILQQMGKAQFGRYLIHYGFASLKGWCNGMPWQDKGLFETTGITSQHLSMSKSTFQKLGGYDENFPHAGFEDYAFSKKIREMGVKIYIYPDSIVYHNEKDRQDVEMWLARKQRGGVTRQVAVNRGHTELKLYFGVPKKLVYSLLSTTKLIWITLLKFIPNIPILDSIYFRLMNILLGTSIFEGYTMQQDRR